MTHLLFVATTGPGVQALECAVVAGHEVTLLSTPEYDFFVPEQTRDRARALAHHMLAVDDVRDTPTVLALLRANNIRPDVVLSTLHNTTPAAAELAARLGVRGTSPVAIEAARNKGLCRQIVRSAGIPSVGFDIVDDVRHAIAALGELRLPVVVKPLAGMGKAVTAIVHSEEEMTAHLRQADELAAALAPGVARELDGRFIIEELAVGPLFSVEVATDGTDITPLVIVRRKTGRDNPVLELGSTVPSGLTDEQMSAMNDYAVRVCRALGLDLGIFHVELILTAGGPQLVEVNPRIAGGAIPDLVRAATGRNLFGILVDIYAGGSVPPRPLRAIAAASHTFLTAAKDCQVRADLALDWFDQFVPQIHSGWSDITPGAMLNKMGTNYDVRGVVRVVRDDVATAEGECVRLMSDIENLLGIEFVTQAAR